MKDIVDFHSYNADELCDGDADVAGKASEVLPVVRSGSLPPFCLDAVEQERGF